MGHLIVSGFFGGLLHLLFHFGGMSGTSPIGSGTSPIGSGTSPIG